MKKIILIHPGFTHPFKSGKIFTSIFKHVDSLVQALKDEFTVVLIKTTDSDKVYGDEVKYLEIDFTSNLVLPAEKKISNSYKLKRAAATKRAIKDQYGASLDLIISENCLTNFSYIDEKIPKLVFFHHTYDNPFWGGLSFMNLSMYFKMNDHLKKGSNFAFVSKFQRLSYIRGLSSKLKPRILKPNFEKLGFDKVKALADIEELDLSKCPVLLNPLELQNKELSTNKKDYVVYVGRCHPEKRIEKIIKLAGQVGKLIKVYCSTTDELKEYEDKIQALASPTVEIYFNHPYSDIMESVKNSTCLLLASNESLSYVAAEAFYYNVPVFHFNKDAIAGNDSPIFEMAPIGYYAYIDKKDNVSVEFNDFINGFNEDLSEIEKFRDRMSIKTFRTNLISTINSMIAKTPKKLFEY